MKARIRRQSAKGAERHRKGKRLPLWPRSAILVLGGFLMRLVLF